MHRKTLTIPQEAFAPGGTHACAWLLVDAAERPLGRVASQIATLLRGKHKPVFSPHLDCGDYVIVLNTKRIALSGAKAKQRYYYHHTGYPGGLKAVQANRLLQERPAMMMRLAVKRMLPKNALGRKILLKLKAYPGAEHPHQSQRPQVFSLK